MRHRCPADIGRGGGEQVFDRQIGRGELGDDAAAVEHQRAMADLGHLLEIGRDDQDRGAGLQRDVEQPVDLRLGADVDAGGRVLEDVELGRQMQPASDDDLLLIAAREQLDRREPGSFGRSPTRRPSSRAARDFRAAARAARTGPRPAATGLRNRFSRTVRFGMIDSPTRSAQTRLMPDSHRLARVDAPRSARPSSTMRPPVDRDHAEQRPADRSPARRRASPTKPTISPACMAAIDRPDRVDHRGVRAPAAARPGVRPAGGRPATARGRRSAGSFRPASSLSTTRSPATRPSRSTTIRSAISNTSSSRCET